MISIENLDYSVIFTTILNIFLRMLCESPAATKVCPDGFSLFEDETCFIVPDTKRTKDGAVEYCNNIGAKLAAMNSKAENDFVGGNTYILIKSTFDLYYYICIMKAL